MNKKELVDKVAELTSMKKKDVKLVIDTVFKSISESLVSGEKVQLVGFGSFEVRTNKKRRGVNPRTGNGIIIPEKKVAKFKAGKELKAMVK